jgi:hypothetical protein
MTPRYGAFNGAVMARKRAPGMGLRHKGPTAPLYGAHIPNPEAVIARGYGAYGARQPQHISSIVNRILGRCIPQ